MIILAGVVIASLMVSAWHLGSIAGDVKVIRKWVSQIAEDIRDAEKARIRDSIIGGGYNHGNTPE
jgi:hypothetical protein